MIAGIKQICIFVALNSVSSGLESPDGCVL